MLREKMIEMLVCDKINYWVHAQMTDDLEELLRIGFKGFNNYTDQELKEEVIELIGIQI